MEPPRYRPLERFWPYAELAEQPTDEELAETVAWSWYVRPEDEPLIAADMRRMGLSTVSGWVTQLLNQWIGQPGGLL